MDADVVCVGFGPASGGFLTTLSREIFNPDGSTAIESPSMPGMPLQVLLREDFREHLALQDVGILHLHRRPAEAANALHLVLLHGESHFA